MTNTLSLPPQQSCVDGPTQPDFDLRTAPRVASQEPLQLWIPDLFDVALLSSSVNEGQGGMGLHSPVPLEPGAALCVRPADEWADDTWVPLEVRHCRPDATGWTLGCRFISPDREVA
jgi:hypothetical protein